MLYYLIVISTDRKSTDAMVSIKWRGFACAWPDKKLIVSPRLSEGSRLRPRSSSCARNDIWIGYDCKTVYWCHKHLLPYCHLDRPKGAERSLPTERCHPANTPERSLLRPRTSSFARNDIRIGYDCKTVYWCYKHLLPHCHLDRPKGTDAMVSISVERSL